jgi:hypothetical protein
VHSVVLFVVSLHPTTAVFATKYTAQFRTLFRRPPRPAETEGIALRARSVALRQLAWQPHERRSKLLQLQTQDYTKPHPVAYLVGDEATLVGRWLINNAELEHPQDVPATLRPLQ